jgi:hypothetical protein
MTLLLVLMALAGPASREASARGGIIEKLSGPGPFFAYTIPFDRLFCVVRTNDGPALGNTFGGGGPNQRCATDGDGDPLNIFAYVSAEFTHGFSDVFTEDDDEFPEVRSMSFAPIVFFRAHQHVDVGIGISRTRFSGTDRVTGEDFALWRWSLPLRARVTWPRVSPGSKWRAVYLVLQADYFPGEVTALDFHAAPGSTFREKHDVVKAWFVGVDVIRLALGR